MRKILAMTLLTTALTFVAARAQAQTFVTPFAGVTFGQDAPDKQLTMGAGLTFMGKAAGLEIDFGYTPDFFNEEDDLVLIADSNLTTLMANLVVGPGVGPVRPYFVVGTGLLRSRVDDNIFGNITSNDWGVNVGGGVLAKVGEHVGIRGDLRYFRNLQDPEDDDDLDIEIGGFDFWRATGGVSLGF